MIGTGEAATLLGWSRAKVKRHAADGLLPIVRKLPGDTGAYLFDRATVERLAKETAA